jgi:MFS family permease
MSSNIKMAAVDPDTATDQRQLFLLVFPPIMLPIFLAVVDSTIVTTALPAMAASFGEVQRISWVVVGYLLANTIAAPVYGRLADMFGRRQLMQMAIGLFCAASVVCALSTSLPMLVLARVLQGLGGGGLMTLSQELIGERVSARQRGQSQGLGGCRRPIILDRARRLTAWVWSCWCCA